MSWQTRVRHYNQQADIAALLCLIPSLRTKQVDIFGMQPLGQPVNDLF
jgi:hypothetical protein